ncbi:FhaA domain-containing protein [Streptomyces sp. NPDC006393]|uniref:FhaA domain-containing protein n=1 Tax=Streptomyces sp. NPDC006393 TaxID=3156763 RepID=UPI0033CEE753
MINRPSAPTSEPTGRLRRAGVPEPYWNGTLMGAYAPHYGGQRGKMRSLSSLEDAMERWILRQECDDRALILDWHRTLVPNAFVIELPLASHNRLVGSKEQLGRHLSNQVRRHAADQGYTFAGPVAVFLAPVEGSKIGRFRVRSRIVPAQKPEKGEPGPQ